MNGTIKRLVRDKGFGFIRTEDGVEYFFHRSSMADSGFDTVQEGRKVTFEEEHSPKGPRAANVQTS